MIGILRCIQMLCLKICEISIYFCWSSVTGDLNCSRGCSTFYCNDRVHYSWCSTSHSISDKNSGWNLCSCGCHWSFHQHSTGKFKVVLNNKLDSITFQNILLLILWSLSILIQVVVAPILLGSYMQSKIPAAVKTVTPFAPLFAVLASSLLACRFIWCCLVYYEIGASAFNFLWFLFSGFYSSVFSENVVRLKSLMVAASLPSDASLILRIQSIFSGEMGTIILAVLLLHLAGFFVGYDYELLFISILDDDNSSMLAFSFDYQYASYLSYNFCTISANYVS